MFKRPHRTKPAATVSSSARKKIINEALSEFFQDPSSAHRTLLQQLVPDGLRMARIFTHLDRPLVLYTDPDGEPLWLKLDKGEGLLVPSLYTLSKFPSLLPVVCTNEAVLTKLTGGADLMVPGLGMSSKTALRGLPARTLVSVCNGNQAEKEPWAVGYLDRSGDELAISETGKAVITIHAKDDFLWQAGSEGVPEKLKLEFPVLPDPELEKVCDRVHSLVIDTPIVTLAAEPTPAQNQIPCEEVDNILQAALKRCIVDRLSPELPMPASAFYSNYILPLRPHDCPKTVGVKNSSFKTLVKWLKSMQKVGLLVVREDRKGGELMLCSLNSTHASLDSLTAYRTMAAAEKQAAKIAADQLNSLIHHDTANTSILMGTVISEAFRASTPAQEQLFQSANLAPRLVHNREAIRTALHLYIKSQGWLQRLIPVDALLAEALGFDRARQPATREELLSKLMSALEPWWTLQRGADVVIQTKGPVPTITLSLKKVQGPKRTTRIAGLELYDIKPEVLATKLKSLCAVSTSIHPSLMSPSLQLPKHLLKGRTPVEVHCQGDQRNIVKKHLIEDLRLPKEAIVEK